MEPQHEFDRQCRLWLRAIKGAHGWRDLELAALLTVSRSDYVSRLRTTGGFQIHHFAAVANHCHVVDDGAHRPLRLLEFAAKPESIAWTANPDSLARVTL